jgi:hypothetical protein
MNGTTQASPHTPNKLSERIEADLKQAMRERDEVKKLTLRSVKTALTELAKPNDIHHLSEEQVIGVLRREGKRRREAAQEFEKAGDSTRGNAELAELAVIERYLPAQLDEAAIEQLARTVIAEIGATSPKEMGKIMAALMPRTGSQADGKLVNTVVRRLLGG